MRISEAHILVHRKKGAYVKHADRRPQFTWKYYHEAARVFDTREEAGTFLRKPGNLMGNCEIVEKGKPLEGKS